MGREASLGLNASPRSKKNWKDDTGIYPSRPTITLPARGGPILAWIRDRAILSHSELSFGGKQNPTFPTCIPFEFYTPTLVKLLFFFCKDAADCVFCFAQVLGKGVSRSNPLMWSFLPMNGLLLLLRLHAMWVEISTPPKKVSYPNSSQERQHCFCSPLWQRIRNYKAITPLFLIELVN